MTRARPRGAIIDLDGTVYVGNATAPGAIEGLRRLRAQSIPHVFLTNNGSRTRQETKAFLAGIGIDVFEEEIVTSSNLLAHRLREASNDPVLCIGGANGLPTAIREVGLTTIGMSGPPMPSLSLAVGWTNRLDFSLLAQLLAIEDRIARVFVTDRDRVYPGESGELLPGTGWIAGAIEALLDRTVVVSGKPSVEAFVAAARTMGLPVSDVVVIGDSLVSDVDPAIAGGARAVLIRGALSRGGSLADTARGQFEISRDLAEAIASAFGVTGVN